MKTSLAALSFSLLWLVGCSEAPPNGHAAATSAALPVAVERAEVQALPSLYEATGTVRARVSTAISSKLMAYVREVKVQLGDRVKEGQTLVTLDSRDLDAGTRRAAAAREELRQAVPEADSAVAAAKANFDLAQTTFQRMNELYGKKSISDQEFDEAAGKRKAAEANYKMMQARRSQLDGKMAQIEEDIRTAEVMRSYAEINAPFAGLVTAKTVEPGILAAPGVPLLTLERDGAYRLEASVDESRLAAIHLGQPVRVKLDGVDRTLEARVSEVVPVVDAASRTYTVKIDLPALPMIRSGSFGRAVFELGSRSILTIPSAAVTERGQLRSVFVAENGVARTRLVTLGQRAGDRVEVLSGLSVGDAVVISGPREIADGSRVEVRR
jgi:membrane fusion protein, multidrug efflux system